MMILSVLALWVYICRTSLPMFSLIDLLAKFTLKDIGATCHFSSVKIKFWMPSNSDSFVSWIKRSPVHVNWLTHRLSTSLFRQPSVQFSSSVVSDFLWPMDCSTSGFPVYHQLPELAQTHVHRVSDIQPSHPLSSPSPPAFNLSQHQGFFQGVSSSPQVAKVFELQLQH